MSEEIENTNDKHTSTEDIDITSTPVSDFDTIVLSGGSTKGILTLGALQYAYDNNLLKKLYTYIGTSAGSIICFLLLIGYTPVEIVSHLCTNQSIEKLQNFNILQMINGNGAVSFSYIYEQLEKMTINKIGYLPTFEDTKIKFNKNLICVTYNFTDKIVEYMSYDTTPHLPCLIALKMSSNLPLIFENFKYGNKFYIDGGIADNFPIDKAEELGKKILGINIVTNSKNFSEPESMGILEYIYKLIFIPMDQIVEYKIAKFAKKSKIINLDYDKLKFFNFTIPSKDKLDIFSSGYEQMKNQFEDYV